NHINLCDSTGETRVERVYMPADTTGTAPVVDGYTLPGSHYTTKEQIKALTTDYIYSSHGTHTAGTAAGSYIAGGYYGVAPEARLVICSMPSNELSDVNVAHSLQYIFDYAESMGLPAVVNMSLGSCDWAHDGTSPLCQFMDELSGPGKIIVVSAGNDGSKPMHLPHSFVNDADTVRSFLLNYNGGVGYSDFVSTWSDDLTPHNFRLTVANRSTGEIVYRTPMTSEIEPDSVLTIFSDTDSILGAYFDGAIQLAAGEESNGKYHSIGVIVGSMTDAAYRVCIELTAPSGVQTHSWAGYSCCFYALGCKGWSNGTSVMSISDMATGDSTISVGAYCSRRTVPAEGGVTTFSRSVPYDIGYFSSYGPDWRGITRPDVVAPGMMVVSSISRYDQSSPPLSTSSPLCLAVGDEYYPFGSMYGTSMSTPVVTGAIALWLEANPNLTPAQIKDILQNTCYRDSYVIGGDARRWGYGKLDVAQGLHYILANRLRGDVNLDGMVDVTDVTKLINIILGNEPEGGNDADIDEDGALSVSDVTALITILLN
ncbi:MAG: S8 family serine peptidase, partial [Muribaculaceae bacterium]|nr:S8 family serine peptidase [Muribaculaceae bacterium]